MLAICTQVCMLANGYKLQLTNANLAYFDLHNSATSIFIDIFKI